MKKYTVYENGMYVAEGTAKKLADKLGMKMNTFYKAVGRTDDGKNRKIEIYEVESD